MANWYVNIDGNQGGPYSEADFEHMRAQGMIPPNAFVWREGMADWVLARDLPGGMAGVAPQAAMPPSSWPAMGGASSAEPVPTGPNGLVIAAYVLGSCALFCSCLTGIPAITCSILALNQPGQAKHAKTALLVSIIGTVLGMACGVVLNTVILPSLEP